jgi:hypothetical protein
VAFLLSSFREAGGSASVVALAFVIVLAFLVVIPKGSASAVVFAVAFGISVEL